MKRAGAHGPRAAATAAAVARLLLPIDAAATTIYGISGDFSGATPSFVFAIDPDAMTVTPIMPPIGEGVGASLAPSMTRPKTLIASIVDAATLTSNLHQVDIPTGAISPPFGSPGPIVGMGHGRDGNLYAAGGTFIIFFPGTPFDLYSVNPVLGTNAFIGTGVDGYQGDIAVNLAGTLFGAIAGDRLARVNKLTGVQGIVGSTGQQIVGLAFSLDGRLWGATQTNRLYEIDPTNGASSFTMNISGLGGGLTFDLASEVFPIDHFLCYRTRHARNLSVALADLFDSGSYSVKPAKLFCTPASKNDEGVFDEDTHLT